MDVTRRSLVSLLAALLLAWVWIVVLARDMYGSMQGAAAWMMTPIWDAPHLLLLWAMWAVMMAAMMLPSVAPMVMLYAGALRNRPDSTGLSQVYALAAGYLLVWAGFSLGATLLQRALASLLVLTPMMEASTPIVSASILFVAGIYQWTPLKQACLRACRSPLSLLMQRWRQGRTGALRMGIEHGIDCLGCCWALMLILFAGGVMNLLVIVALTTWVMVEKLAPFGEQSARAGGALLIVTAGWLLLR